MNQKNVAFFKISLSIFFVLMGCSNTAESLKGEEKKNEENVVKFYPSIDKATANNTFSVALDKDSLGEQLLSLKDDNHQIIFFKSSYENKDTITVYKYQLKLDSGQEQYSNPTNATQIVWQAQLDSQKKSKLSNVEMIQLAIKMNNPKQTFNLSPETTKLQWGISKAINTPKLKIDGQTATKVIPITLDGDNVYFWYFENLTSANAPDSMEVTF
ncbi:MULTISPECIES: hypothetical protein [Listeria]|uniref:hypothetical protein n=1 Tax=Listeria TaxID=1637 RepID=UPI000B595398|nr:MULTISPECIES: hypothetical protein [Listeria]